MRKTIRSRLTATAAASLFLFAGAARADVIAINFDSLKNLEFVDEAYNGGAGNLGSTGPNHGVSFKNAQTLDQDLNNAGLLLTAPNALTFVDDTIGVMNVAAGFGVGLAFNYSAPVGDHLVHMSIWGGLDGTGDLLAEVTLPVTFNGTYVPDCAGKVYCPPSPFGVGFNGVAKSVTFDSLYAVYDDITLGALRPVTGGGAVPEPASWALMIAGFAGLGGSLRRARRADRLAAQA